MIRTIVSNPSFRAAVFYGVSGASFVLGTLMLARVLPPAEFGVLALAIALANLGISGGTSGLTGVWLRHPIRAGREILRASIAVAVATALALAAFSRAAYDFEWPMVAILACAVSVGGLSQTGLVPLQKQHRFDLAVPLSQVPNLVLLLAAFLLIAVPEARVPVVPVAFMAVSWLFVAAWAWSNSLRYAGLGESFGRAHWPDAAQFTVSTIAAEVLIQLERLLIPFVLTMNDLALFAVVAAIAVAPFSTLEKAVNSTLIPRLQRAPDVAARRLVLSREARLLAGITVVGGGLLLGFGPFVIERFVSKAFIVHDSLVLVAIASGVARLFAAVGRSAAAAFCSSDELRRFSICAWIATILALVAGWALAWLGLAGLILGVACGWLIRGFCGLLIARPYITGRLAQKMPRH